MSITDEAAKKRILQAMLADKNLKMGRLAEKAWAEAKKIMAEEEKPTKFPEIRRIAEADDGALEGDL